MKEKVKTQLSEFGFRAELLDSVTFAEAQSAPECLVQQILVADQPAVLGGPKKAMKTSIAVDLALSLGTGTPFLGKFQVPRRMRVALLSGESGGAALLETARRVCQAKGVALDESCQVLWSLDLPRLGSRRDLAALQRVLERRRVRVVIIDPLYLCLGGGASAVSPANLFEVGPLLWRAGKACLDSGTTPVLVHHTTKEAGRKGSRGKMLDLDDLAFSGLGEYARQWLLVSPREPFRQGKHRLSLAVGGSQGHSGHWAVDIDEGVLGDDFTGRRWEVAVRPGSTAQSEKEEDDLNDWM